MAARKPKDPRTPKTIAGAIRGAALAGAVGGVAAPKREIGSRKTTPETIENKVLKGVMNTGAAKKKQKESLAWFYKRLKTSANAFPKGSFSDKKKPFIGGMFHFVYDAKHKDTLPYFEKFPLVIHIEKYHDGFLGLNLHYLPPILRAKLLDMMINKFQKTTTAKTYMAVTYPILQSASKSGLFQPCLKRYLTSHMVSKAIYVDSEQWEEVAFLPTAQWHNATNKKVYADSKGKI